MVDINDVADYVILKAKAEEDIPLDNLKLQKLLYYIQAWNLAFYNEPFFEGKFQAWVHGPVNREIYDRFNPTKYLYSEIRLDDVKDKNCDTRIPEEDQDHINNVLSTYMKYSGIQLETLTHKELPWVEARKGFSTFDYCEVEINEETMKSYYSSLVND